jgi:hypothetical protein
MADIFQDEEAEGGIVVNPNSAYAKEMRKWEMWPSIYGKNPGRPYAQYATEYPRMLYIARKHPRTGKYSCGDVYPNAMDFLTPNDFERAALFVESFNRSCQKKVEDESACNKAISDGWSLTQEMALQRAEAMEIEIAKVAAEVEFGARRMSEPAQRELAAAHAATEHHVTDVQPQRKRGRPAKGTRVFTGAGEVEG